MTRAKEVLDRIDATRSWQEDLYVHLHSHPELSFAGDGDRGRGRPAARGVSGTTCSRSAAASWACWPTGPGPTVLMRADMDALPVTEPTGLPLCVDRTADGRNPARRCGCRTPADTTSMSPACSVRPSCLAGAGTPGRAPSWRSSSRREETAAGARSMVDDGLAAKSHGPTSRWASTSSPLMRPASWARQAGPVLSAGDTIKITVYGKGSHGSMPHLGVDPVVLAASIVLRLQTIVARETAPGDFAVVTVGSIHRRVEEQHHPRPCGAARERPDLRHGVRDEDRRRDRADRPRRVRRRRARPQPPTFEYYDQYPLTDNDAEVSATVVRGLPRPTSATDRVHRLGRVTGQRGLQPASRTPSGSPYTYWGLGGFARGMHVLPQPLPVLRAGDPAHAADAGTEAIVVAAMAYLGKEEWT